MKRGNNKGSTLILVIVAMSVIAVLAVVALWISLSNLQMKVTDEKNQDNFYSAESVLDQICTGLQGDVSAAYTSAYTVVMQQYNSLSEEERQALFSNTYVKELRKLVCSSDSESKYSLSKLISYVESDLTDSNTYPYAKIQTTTGESENSDGLLNTYVDELVIKGIKVIYTDEKGYTSIIRTDISLEVPHMEFSSQGKVPKLFTYSLIGNSGLNVTGNASLVDLDGNVYSGSDYVTKGADNSTVSVQIANGSKLNVEKSSYFIAEGDIEVGKLATANSSTGSSFSVGKDCQLWTDNINVNGANTSLDGVTYVSDDLTISGRGSKVSIGKDNSGKYVGYGNSTDLAEDSSAIIINGINTTLDMSQLQEVLIAGYAFINTSSIANVNPNAGTNPDVRTGESISVKGDQIAYLVPAECIGTSLVDGEVKSKYNRNPLKYTEYLEIHNSKEYTEINADIVSSRTEKSLSSYISSGHKIDDYIKTVFVPSKSGNSDDGFVYYYINLPDDMASQYYQDYYNKDKTKLELYNDFYTEQIQVNESADANIYTIGTYNIYNGKNLQLLKGIVDDIDIDAESATLANNYTALNSKLIKDYSSLSANELSATLFTNIINEDKMNSLTSVAAGRRVNFYATIEDVQYQAVVIDGTFEFNSTAKANNISLIIATGDVTVSADFTGTIITKGKIVINKDCKIKNSSQQVFKNLLLSEVGEGDSAEKLAYIFDDCDSYIGKSAFSSDSKDSDSAIDYNEVIRYSNWKKE